MQDTSEPSKRRGVRVEKIRIRHLTEHFLLLFEPHLPKLKKSLAKRYRSVHIYINKNRQSLLRPFFDKATAGKPVFKKLHKSINFSQISASIVVIVITVVFAHYALAASSTAKGIFPGDEEVADKEKAEVLYEPIEAAYSVSGTSVRAANAPPTGREHVVVKRVNLPITAYSSTVGQTDSTPFITASGTRVRDGIVAANFLPIGTKIRIPEFYGDKIFVVEDRMNSRYWEMVDIWMSTYDEAYTFGLRHSYIEVIEEI